MAVYKSKHRNLVTYATDGKPIRFIGGLYNATRKPERDALDKLKTVKKVVGATSQSKPKAQPKAQPKTQTKTQPKAQAKTQPKTQSK